MFAIDATHYSGPEAAALALEETVIAMMQAKDTGQTWALGGIEDRIDRLERMICALAIRTLLAPSEGMNQEER